MDDVEGVNFTDRNPRCREHKRFKEPHPPDRIEWPRKQGNSAGDHAAEVSMAVVLITGCSSGIGLATARHFARLGDEVHAGVRHPSTAWELTAAIESDKLKIAPLTLDVDDDASVRRGVQEVIARSGRIDVLVNNAGIGGGGPIEDV